MELTMTQAASKLGLSINEVKRRIADGRLKGRKKTASKFSDWVVEVDMPSSTSIVEQASKAIEAPKPESAPKPAPELEPEQITDPQDAEIKNIEEENAHDAETKNSDRRIGPDPRGQDNSNKWWF